MYRRSLLCAGAVYVCASIRWHRFVHIYTRVSSSFLGCVKIYYRSGLSKILSQYSLEKVLTAIKITNMPIIWLVFYLCITHISKKFQLGNIY